MKYIICLFPVSHSLFKKCASKTKVADSYGCEKQSIYPHSLECYTKRLLYDVSKMYGYFTGTSKFQESASNLTVILHKL